MENLESQYFDPAHEAGFSGARNLIRVNEKKTSADAINEWLTRHDTYTLHKAIRRKYKTQFYNPRALDHLWEADLIQLSSLKDYNDGVSYLLAVIDVLSKFVWIRPLRDKTVNEVTRAFRDILDNSESRTPFMVQTDKGREFVGSTLQSLFREYGIQFRLARSPIVKASVIERFIRTFKERLYRYFTFKNTKRYVDVLQDIVTAYNKNIHSTTKLAPAAVTAHNAHIARKNLLARARQRQGRGHRTPKFRVGQYMRISREKNVFEKGAAKSWSDEIFRIKKVLHRQNLYVYLLQDLRGEDIDGIFYPQELSLVHPDRAVSGEYQIEKVIKTKGSGKNKQYFVKWLGWNDNFNSWVNAAEVRDL